MCVFCYIAMCTIFVTLKVLIINLLILNVSLEFGLQLKVPVRTESRSATEHGFKRSMRVLFLIQNHINENTQ